MSRIHEKLLAAAHALQQAVTQAPTLPDWRTHLDRALDRLEEAVRQRGAALQAPEGLLADVDRPRVPSPAVDREASNLRMDLGHLLDEIHALRAGQADEDPFGLLDGARALIAEVE